MIVAVLPGPAARAQPRDAAPPPPAEAPPPPVVQNVAQPPVVHNTPPVPVVHDAPPTQAIVPPPDLATQERRSGRLLLSSVGTYVLAYGLTVLLGAIRSAEDDPAASRLYIPVLGPLLFWDGTNMEIDGESGSYLVLSTLAQTVGLLGIFFGILELGEGDEGQGGG